ncbi:MAG: hypothetical protein ABI142_01330 [Bryocella sp.]
MAYRKVTQSFALMLIIGCGGVGQAQQHEVGRLIPASSLGTSTAITKPTLELRGGSLLLSDAPEEINNSRQLPAVMYRDKVTGDFRVFYHHQNESSKILSVGVAITNTSSQPEILFVRGAGIGVNVSPDLAGQAAASSFMSSARNISFVTVLLPGKTHLKAQNLPKLDTASGILEYLLVTVPGDVNSLSLRSKILQSLTASSASEERDCTDMPAGFGMGTATVSTLAYTGKQPSDPSSLPILPGDTHSRGTFAHSDRSGLFTISKEGLQSLTVDAAAPGKKFSDPMPNEYELGMDAVDGSTPVYNDGNYGVIYSFHIGFPSANSSPPQTFALLMQPSGGAGHFVAFTNEQQALSPYVTYKSAWWFSDITLTRQRTRVDLQTTLPGGASGPQTLLFDPGFIDQ